MSNQKHFIIVTLDCEDEIRTYVVSANTKTDARNKVNEEIESSHYFYHPTKGKYVRTNDEYITDIQEVKIREDRSYTDPFTNTRFNTFTPNEEGVHCEGVVIKKYSSMWDRIISKDDLYCR